MAAIISRGCSFKDCRGKEEEKKTKTPTSINQGEALKVKQEALAVINMLLLVSSPLRSLTLAQDPLVMQLTRLRISSKHAKEEEEEGAEGEGKKINTGDPG